MGAVLGREPAIGVIAGNEAIQETLDDFVPPSWHAMAMCSGKTAIFFATPGERDGRRAKREALARAYCACCPVAAECREAGRSGREHGLWGGENDEERAGQGFGSKSPHRRAVAAAARAARDNESSPENSFITSPSKYMP